MVPGDTRAFTPSPDPADDEATLDGLRGGRVMLVSVSGNAVAVVTGSHPGPGTFQETRWSMRSINVVRRSGLIFTLLACGVAAGADAPGMFTPPKGWQPMQRSDKLISYNAPKLKEGEACRVIVIAPSKLGGGFKQWFPLDRGRDKVVEESKRVEGKTKKGYETLRQSQVLTLPWGTLHRLRYALRDGDHFALIVCTATSAELAKAAAQEAELLADSWDFTGAFPAAEKKQP